MKKYIFLSIVIVILSISNFTLVNAFNVVGPYNSSSECNTILKENSNKTEGNYDKYERSKCYENEGKFQYNICKKGEECINTSSAKNNESENTSTNTVYKKVNPYVYKTITIKGKNGTIESFFGKKIDTIIQKLKGKNSKIDSVKKLISFKDKLTKIGNLDKFKNNKLVQNLVGYIKFEILEEVEKLKAEITKNEENNGLDDFLCKLEGKKDCNKNECPKGYERNKEESSSSTKACKKKEVSKSYSAGCILLDSGINEGMSVISIQMSKNPLKDKWGRKPTCYGSKLPMSLENMKAKYINGEWKCQEGKKDYYSINKSVYRCFDAAWEPRIFEVKTQYYSTIETSSGYKYKRKSISSKQVSGPRTEYKRK